MKEPNYKPVNFLDFSQNFFSQNGEDGIILKALELIQAKTLEDNADKKFVVDVGAWDGKHLSNTYHFISNHGYGSVLIECDKKKFKELKRNTNRFENQFLVNKFINFEGESDLDSILKTTPVPNNFDLLSIDIDGMDYYIWESLTLYRPKLVIIEFNPTIPAYVNFIQSKSFAVKHGSSSMALINLGLSKGYVLIAKTHCNLIFMAEHFANSIDFDKTAIKAESERFFDENATYLFSGYNGELISNRERLILPWHGLNPAISDLNVLPKFLQKYPHDYSRFEKTCYGFFVNMKMHGLAGIELFVRGALNEFIGSILKRLSPTQRALVHRIKYSVLRK